MSIIEINGNLYRYNDTQAFVAAPNRYAPMLYDVPGSMYGKIISRPLYRRIGLPRGIALIAKYNSKNLYVKCSFTSNLENRKKIAKLFPVHNIRDWRAGITASIELLEKYLFLPDYVVRDFHDNIDQYLELVDLNGKPLNGDLYTYPNGFPKKVSVGYGGMATGGVRLNIMLNKIIKGVRSRRIFCHYANNNNFFNDYERLLIIAQKEEFIGREEFKACMDGASEVLNYADNYLQDIKKAITHDAATFQKA